MTSDDIVELVSEMKRLDVMYFEYNGLKVAFRDAPTQQWAPNLFEDQKKLVDELEGPALIDAAGKPASEGFNDEDLFGSS